MTESDVWITAWLNDLPTLVSCKALTADRTVVEPLPMGTARADELGNVIIQLTVSPMVTYSLVVSSHPGVSRKPPGALPTFRHVELTVTNPLLPLVGSGVRPPMLATTGRPPYAATSRKQLGMLCVVWAMG